MQIHLLATWIPALLIGLSGVMTLSGNPKVLETMTTLGVGRHVRLLGVMELAFAALFVVPATMKLGFLQGINVLPGSFMSGQTRWAVNGVLAALAGLGLLVIARRRPGG